MIVFQVSVWCMQHWFVWNRWKRQHENSVTVFILVLGLQTVCSHGKHITQVTSHSEDSWHVERRCKFAACTTTVCCLENKKKIGNQERRKLIPEISGESLPDKMSIVLEMKFGCRFYLSILSSWSRKGLCMQYTYSQLRKVNEGNDWLSRDSRWLFDRSL